MKRHADWDIMGTRMEATIEVHSRPVLKGGCWPENGTAAAYRVLGRFTLLARPTASNA